MYNIDWAKLINRNLAFALRKPKIIAFLTALVSPVVSLFSSFNGFKDSIENELKINGQVRILAYYLNENFDNTERRITIEDGDTIDVLYIFLESENKPVFLPQFISGTDVDFIVKVPFELNGLNAQLTSFIKKYKLASKRFRIDYFGDNGTISPPPQNS